jgi:hypothetical protein
MLPRLRVAFLALTVTTGLVACTSVPEVPTPAPSASAPVANASSQRVTPVANTAQPSGATSLPTASSPAEHRIGVREVDGAGEFYDRVTGEPFTPRGNNLIRLDSSYHDTFDPRSYDPADLDNQLAGMAALGYNVVRVFLDHRVGGLIDSSPPAGLSGAYLDNLVDFLRMARSHGLYVMFTQDWLPDGYPMVESPTVSNVNVNYLTQSGVAANADYFRDLVNGLVERGAPLDAIWSFELRNELYMLSGYPPFSLTSGNVTAPNGQTYDLADADSRRALLEDGIVYWVDSMREAILSVDPTALVSVGFFVPQGPNPVRQGDDRIVETSEVLRQSTADFIDLHGYPGVDLPLPKHLENFGMTAPISKPVVMGEMGAFHSAFSTLQDATRALISWQADSCAYGFDGWLLWTWDTPGETWSAIDAEQTIGNALAPVNRPDPCSTQGGKPPNLALNQPAHTSAALGDSPGSAAVDGVFDTLWSSGDYATQWIEVQLAQPLSKGTVKLTVSQYPDGHTEHRVYGRTRAGGPLVLLHTFRGNTHDGQVLTFDLAGDTAFKFLRVETVASPSWVAWREIEVDPAQ